MNANAFNEIFLHNFTCTWERLSFPDTLSRAPIYRKVSCEEQALADDVKA